jgi:hypothetical protein
MLDSYLSKGSDIDHISKTFRAPTLALAEAAAREAGEECDRILRGLQDARASRLAQREETIARACAHAATVTRPE